MDFIFQYLQDSLAELLMIAVAAGVVLGAVIALLVRRGRQRS